MKELDSRTWTPRESAIYHAARLENSEEVATLTAERDQAFTKGVESVLRIRCWDHKEVPAYNAKEASGAECPVCKVKEVELERDALRTALLKHGRHDSTCAWREDIRECDCGLYAAEGIVIVDGVPTRGALGGKS